VRKVENAGYIHEVQCCPIPIHKRILLLGLYVLVSMAREENIYGGSAFLAFPTLSHTSSLCTKSRTSIYSTAYLCTCNFRIKRMQQILILKKGNQEFVISICYEIQGTV
jgi:hypothetical protein